MKVFYSFFFCLLTSIGLAQISIKEDIYVYISPIDFEGLSTKETIEELEYKKSSFTKGAENVKKYKDAQKNRYKERLAYPLSEYEPRYVSHPIITEIEYYKETYDLILENLAFEEVFESNKTKILLVDEVDYKDRHQKFNKNEKLSQSYIINIREISTKEKTIKADSISEITNIENVKIDYQFYHPQKIKTIEVNFDKSQIVNNEYFNYERIADGFLVDIKQKKINSLIDIKAYDKDGQEIEINAISSNIFTDKRLEETIIAYNIFFDELIGFVKSGATLDQLIEKSKTGKVSYGEKSGLEVSIRGKADKVLFLFGEDIRTESGNKILQKKTTSNDFFGIYKSTDSETYEKKYQLVDKTKSVILKDKYVNIEYLGGNYFACRFYDSETKKGYTEILYNSKNQIKDLKVRNSLIENNIDNSYKTDNITYELIENDYLLVFGQEKAILLNPKGEVIQQAQKSKKEFMSYHNTTFTLSDEKGIKVFDKTNNYQLSESFDDVVECDVFIKERLKVEKDRKYGVIDTNGKILLPIEYDACECLKDDFLVEKNGAKFILSSNGNQFDLSRYKNIKVHNPFANTFFIEEENGNRIYNTKTEKITDFDFEDYQPLNEIYYYAVSKNSKYGAIDYNSDLIIPMEYDEITETKGSHFLTINNTSKGHKFFFFDPKGNLLKTYEAKQYQVWMLLNVFSIILDDKFYINYKGEITDIDKSK